MSLKTRRFIYLVSITLAICLLVAVAVMFGVVAYNCAAPIKNATFQECMYHNLGRLVICAIVGYAVCAIVAVKSYNG